MPKKPYIPGHQVQLLHSGTDYFDALIDLIRSAKKILHLQVYIFDDDIVGNKVARALHAAVARGVHVFVMVDGFGSGSLSREFKEKMNSYGISFRTFSPLHFPGFAQAGRRLHHKICVADADAAIVGGINIADKYLGDRHHKAWFDYAIQIHGPVCNELDLICQKIWKRRFVRYFLTEDENWHAVNDGVLLRVSQNDWFRRRNQISSAYKYMLKDAKKEILIVASYFIPTRRLLNILLYAAKRKLDVRIMLSGSSDVPFIKGAMVYLYGKLLKSGVRIFEYKESMLHAKVCVVDREWSSIGSHNLNHLSEFSSMELNIDILDKPFAEKFADELSKLMETKCSEINLYNFRKESSLWTRLHNWLSYRLVRASQQLLFFLNKKKGKGF